MTSTMAPRTRPSACHPGLLHEQADDGGTCLTEPVTIPAQDLDGPRVQFVVHGQVLHDYSPLGHEVSSVVVVSVGGSDFDIQVDAAVEFGHALLAAAKAVAA